MEQTTHEIYRVYPRVTDTNQNETHLKAELIRFEGEPTIAVFSPHENNKGQTIQDVRLRLVGELLGPNTDPRQLRCIEYEKGVEAPYREYLFDRKDGVLYQQGAPLTHTPEQFESVISSHAQREQARQAPAYDSLSPDWEKGVPLPAHGMKIKN